EKTQYGKGAWPRCPPTRVRSSVALGTLGDSGVARLAWRRLSAPARHDLRRDHDDIAQLVADPRRQKPADLDRVRARVELEVEVEITQLGADPARARCRHRVDLRLLDRA